MATLREIKAPKTYISVANAIKAVEKKIPADMLLELNYIITHELVNNVPTGRVFPLFIGQQAIHAGVHFNFNVMA